MCVPGYLTEETLRKIAPHITKGTQVGSVICSNGFFWMATEILGGDSSLFGFQRVPFISRVTTYGKSAEIKGYKSSLKIAGNSHCDLTGLASFFTTAFDTPVFILNHYLEATLTNSNPLLHPCRIYALLSQADEYDQYDHETLFYEEWDDNSSRVLIACDEEFQRIISKLAINTKEIPSLLDYYESTDAVSLTHKIRSITAFKGIKMAMYPDNKKFKIDYSNRYFTEDIPYGLLVIKSLGILTNTATPTIDDVIFCIQQKMGKSYLTDCNTFGADSKQAGVVQNYSSLSSKHLQSL